MGYELVAVEWLPSGRSTLRLSVDSPNGFGIDDAIRVNQRVSLLLDESDPLPGAYTLEVSSPGIDRPVQRAADFVRFAGKRAKLVLVEGLPRRRYSGVLGGMDGDEVIITVEGETFRLPFSDVDRAHLVLDLAEYAELAPRRDEPAPAQGDRAAKGRGRGVPYGGGRKAKGGAAPAAQASKPVDESPVDESAPAALAGSTSEAPSPEGDG